MALRKTKTPPADELDTQPAATPEPEPGPAAPDAHVHLKGVDASGKRPGSYLQCACGDYVEIQPTEE